MMNSTACRMMMVVCAASTAFGGMCAVSASAGDGAELYGPVPYLCIEDSPLDTTGLGVTFVLEDFEDSCFVPGVTASTGSIANPGSITDSVDCDDGLIDGSGNDGHSWFMVPGSTGITFAFDEVALGGFPTQAGVVWTDGATINLVEFEAWDATGASLGLISVGGIGDGSFAGGTNEDRFFGVTNSGGISAIHIKSIPQGGGGGIEVDHLQFGPVTTMCTADVNGSGNVDVEDLLAFLTAWGTGTIDFNCDGLTDVIDLLILLGQWGRC